MLGQGQRIHEPWGWSPDGSQGPFVPSQPALLQRSQPAAVPRAARAATELGLSHPSPAAGLPQPGLEWSRSTPLLRPLSANVLPAVVTRSPGRGSLWALGLSFPGLAPVAQLSQLPVRLQEAHVPLGALGHPPRGPAGSGESEHAAGGRRQRGPSWGKLVFAGCNGVRCPGPCCCPVQRGPRSLQSHSHGEEVTVQGERTGRRTGDWTGES